MKQEVRKRANAFNYDQPLGTRYADAPLLPGLQVWRPPLGMVEEDERCKASLPGRNEK